MRAGAAFARPMFWSRPYLLGHHGTRCLSGLNPFTPTSALRPAQSLSTLRGPPRDGAARKTRYRRCVFRRVGLHVSLPAVVLPLVDGNFVTHIGQTYVGHRVTASRLSALPATPHRGAFLRDGRRAGEWPGWLEANRGQARRASSGAWLWIRWGRLLGGCFHTGCIWPAAKSARARRRRGRPRRPRCSLSRSWGQLRPGLRPDTEPSPR